MPASYSNELLHPVPPSTAMHCSAVCILDIEILAVFSRPQIQGNPAEEASVAPPELLVGLPNFDGSTDSQTLPSRPTKPLIYLMCIFLHALICAR